jgi:hypothetical protein
MTALPYAAPAAGPTSTFWRRVTASVVHLVVGGALLLAGMYLAPSSVSAPAQTTAVPSSVLTPAPYDTTGGLVWTTYREAGGRIAP